MKEIRQNNNRQWFINDSVYFYNGYALVKAFNQKGKTGWSIINKNYQEAFASDYFKFENHIDSVKVYNELIITKKFYHINNQSIIEYKMWIIKDNNLVEISQELFLHEIFERTPDRSRCVALINDICAVRKLDILHTFPPRYVVCEIEDKNLKFAESGFGYLWSNLPNNTVLTPNKSKIIYLKHYR